MCGRFVLRTPPAEVARHFRTRGAVPNKPPSWNIAPTHDVLAVAFANETRDEPRQRALTTLRWGLIPSWAKDSKLAATMINAKAETCTDKPAFRDAFTSRRCIVPADAFYEWKREGKAKQPYAFVMRDRSVFGFAGLWERWRDSKSGETLRTCTIITTTPNPLTAEVHDRMPVILPPDAYGRWLGEEPADAGELQALLAPFPAEAMESFPVSERVGNVKNDDESLIEPAAPIVRDGERQASLF
ncbi:MAG TPA: SOS response-associated peptidase [Alphaproteobacteria bacterium]|jgi:putative SOS response-associated peptidase YedK|nr:SOS response-associated peptidase [Alphaproteobacteria bacterium]